MQPQVLKAHYCQHKQGASRTPVVSINLRTLEKLRRHFEDWRVRIYPCEVEMVPGQPFFIIKKPRALRGKKVIPAWQDSELLELLKSYEQLN